MRERCTYYRNRLPAAAPAPESPGTMAPPPEDDRCQLAGGVFEVAVQAFLLISALAGLAIKRRFERPKRVRIVWLCDVAKQCVGGSFIHVANMALSSYIADAAGGGSFGGDPCAFYFCNFFADSTLGVFVVAAVHGGARKFVRKLARGRRTHLDVIGDYGAPPSQRVFFSQLAIWVFALAVNKIFIAFLLYKFRIPISSLAASAFAPMRRQESDFELIFVMVLAPWVLTTMQFQLFDAVLKGPVTRRAGLVDDISEIPLLTAFPGSRK